MMKPDDVVALLKKHQGDQDLSLLLAIAEKESGCHDTKDVLTGFDDRAFANDRNGGSYGLFQLDMPTARDRGFSGTPWELYDPATNADLAVKQLDWIGTFLRNNSAYGLANVIAAYNEGVGNVMRGNPDPRYVAMVTAYRTGWQRRLGLGVS